MTTVAERAARATGVTLGGPTPAKKGKGKPAKKAAKGPSVAERAAKDGGDGRLVLVGRVEIVALAAPVRGSGLSSTSARRCEVSDKNSARPWTVTPHTSPPPPTASATTHTRGSRRRFRTF